MRILERKNICYDNQKDQVNYVLNQSCSTETFQMNDDGGWLYNAVTMKMNGC